MTYRVSSAHEEQSTMNNGGERVYAVNTTGFLGDEQGNVRALQLTEVVMENGRFQPVPGTERELPAELVLLAMGFTGPEQDNGLVGQLGLDLDERGNIRRDAEFRTNVPNVFVAGDAGRGQSLIVWAIAEGRSAAVAVDGYLGGGSNLAGAIEPTTRQLLV
jgi:glutamate synthase (NADPH/NADH) small chain